MQFIIPFEAKFFNIGRVHCVHLAIRVYKGQLKPLDTFMTILSTRVILLIVTILFIKIIMAIVIIMAIETIKVDETVMIIVTNIVFFDFFIFNRVLNARNLF